MNLREKYAVAVNIRGSRNIISLIGLGCALFFIREFVIESETIFLILAGLILFPLSIYFFLKIIGVIKESTPLKTIICPQCLKSIIIDKIIVTCPFCDTEYSGKKDHKTIFVGCPECEGRKIPAIRCYHCQGVISLFDEYNRKELEAKIYD